MSGEHLGGYPEPPAVGSEAATLLGSLERQRATFEWKCADLDASGLSARLPTSDLSLGRLLKHLASMEDLIFTRDLGGRVLPEPWAGQEPSTRSEWVFSSADDDVPETLYRLWRDAVDRSRVVLHSALYDASWVRQRRPASYVVRRQPAVRIRSSTRMALRIARKAWLAPHCHTAEAGYLSDDPVAGILDDGPGTGRPERPR